MIIQNLSTKFKRSNIFKTNPTIKTPLEWNELREQYISTKASVEENVYDNKIDLKFVINETDPIYINKINIFGNNVTKETVIRNQLEIDEGDPFNDILFTRSINNIKNLNFLINECKTEFISLLADDDESDPKGIIELKYFLI